MAVSAASASGLFATVSAVLQAKMFITLSADLVEYLQVLRHREFLKKLSYVPKLFLV